MTKKEQIIKLIKEGYFERKEIALKANTTINAVNWYFSKNKNEFEKYIYNSKKARFIKLLNKGIFNIEKILKITMFTKNSLIWTIYHNWTKINFFINPEILLKNI